jgi:hypothetical protein
LEIQARVWEKRPITTHNSSGINPRIASFNTSHSSISSSELNYINLLLMLPSFTHNCSPIRCDGILDLKKPRHMASINIVSCFQLCTSILSFWTVLPHACLSSVSLDESPLPFLCLLASCHDLIPRILPMSRSRIDWWGEFLELDRVLFRPLNIRLFYCSSILNGLVIRCYASLRITSILMF